MHAPKDVLFEQPPAHDVHGEYDSKAYEEHLETYIYFAGFPDEFAMPDIQGFSSCRTDRSDE